MDNNYANRPSTTTHIRTITSPGVSYVTIKFFNANLSFQFVPFSGKDNTGRDQYDKKNTIMTTINYEGASLFHRVATDIMNGRLEGNIQAVILCNGGVTITMSYIKGQDGQGVTTLTVTKDGKSIPFRFNTATVTVQQNGQVTQRVVETGLDVFAKTLYGYLTGINSDRHLDKWTEDYAKSQDGQNGETGSGAPSDTPSGASGAYQRNNGYQRGGYNNNRGGYQKGGYQRNYGNNNGSGYQPRSGGSPSTPAPWDNSQGQSNQTPVNNTQSVGISSYSIAE